MRLTHSVTCYPQDGTANMYAEIASDVTDVRPILIRYTEEDGPTVCLSYEQFDVIADLVWAHRPDSAIKDADILCGARTDDDADALECCLVAGHLAINGYPQNHMTRTGGVFWLETLS